VHILLTNDDGYRSPGLQVLAAGLKGLGKLSIIAPHVQRSGVARAITIHRSLRARDISISEEVPAYAVDGTPADCVKLALNGLLDERPDIVVSGINMGHNAGINTLYSGTVAAAAEGALLGLPSIAVSLAVRHAPYWWETATAVTRALLTGRDTVAVQPGTVLNVNVPNVPIHEISGYRSARMSPSLYEDVYEPKGEDKGAVKYVNVGKFREAGGRQDTDMAALKAGFVSLTPLAFDLTHAEDLARLQQAIPALTPLLDREKEAPASNEPAPAVVLTGRRSLTAAIRGLCSRLRQKKTPTPPPAATEA